MGNEPSLDIKRPGIQNLMSEADILNREEERLNRDIIQSQNDERRAVSTFKKSQLHIPLLAQIGQSGMSAGGLTQTSYDKMQFDKAMNAAKYLKALKAKLQNTKSKKEIVVQDIINSYCSIFGKKEDQLSLAEIVNLAEFARRYGSKDIAKQLYETGIAKTTDPATIVDLSIRAYELGSDVEFGNYIYDKIADLKANGDESWPSLYARFSMVYHKRNLSKSENPERMKDIELEVTKHLGIRHDQIILGNFPTSPEELIHWIDMTRNIIRHKSAQMLTKPVDERKDIANEIKKIETKTFELILPFVRLGLANKYEDGVITIQKDEVLNLDGAYYPMDSSYPAKSVYEKLSLMHAETVLFSELYQEKPLSALKRFNENVRNLFPESESIKFFEKGICSQFDGLCSNGSLVPRDNQDYSSALRTALGHIYDNDFLNELGWGFGGGGAGLASCYGVGLLMGPEGLAVSAPVCSALVAGGFLVGFGGARTASIYKASEQISESYKTGYSFVSHDTALMNGLSAPSEAGMIMSVGLLSGVGLLKKLPWRRKPLPSISKYGTHDLNGIVKYQMYSNHPFGAWSDREFMVIKKLVASESIKPLSESNKALAYLKNNFDKSWGFLGKGYGKIVNNKPAYLVFGGASVYDLATDANENIWLVDANYKFDGFNHWWGFAGSALLLNRFASVAVKTNAAGLDMGTAIGTGLNVYFQRDTGASFESIDWNRAFKAGYVVMLGTIFMYKSMLYGREYYLQSSPVGRVLNKASDVVDNVGRYPMKWAIRPVARKAETYSANILSRTTTQSGMVNSAKTKVLKSINNGASVVSKWKRPISDRPFLRPIILNDKNIRYFVRSNVNNPQFTIVGRVKMTAYITGGVMVGNYATADLQGVDAFNTTMQRGLKTALFNVGWGSVQARLNFESAFGQFSGRIVGSTMEIGLGKYLNPFAGQGLYMKDVKSIISNYSCDEKLNEKDWRRLLSKLVAGVSETNVVHIGKGYSLRAYNSDELKHFVEFVKNVDDEDLSKLQKFVDSMKLAIDEGLIKRDIERRAVFILLAVLGMRKKDGCDCRFEAPVKLLTDNKIEKFTRSLNFGEYDMYLCL